MHTTQVRCAKMVNHVGVCDPFGCHSTSELPPSTVGSVACSPRTPLSFLLLFHQQAASTRWKVSLSPFLSLPTPEQRTLCTVSTLGVSHESERENPSVRERRRKMATLHELFEQKRVRERLNSKDASDRVVKGEIENDRAIEEVKNANVR